MILMSRTDTSSVAAESERGKSLPLVEKVTPVVISYIHRFVGYWRYKRGSDVPLFFLSRLDAHINLD